MYTKITAILALSLFFFITTVPVQTLAVLTNERSAHKEETVMFNTKSLKYHRPTCSAARRCTVNCIPVEKSKAISQGGVPCKLCGG